MNEFLFYVGIVLSLASLILAIILFFTQKIPAVIRFFLKIKNEKVIKVLNVENTQNTKNTPADTRKGFNDTGTELLDDGGTELLSNQTELLDMTDDYATELLDLENAHDYKGDKNVIS